jgi:hypothetical protein
MLYIANEITPAESSLAVVTGHGKVTRNDILNNRRLVNNSYKDLLDWSTCLDGTCKQVTIMGKTSCKWRSIVESCNIALLVIPRCLASFVDDLTVGLSAAGEFYLSAKGIDFPPPLEEGLFFSGKVNRHG